MATASLLVGVANTRTEALSLALIVAGVFQIGVALGVTIGWLLMKS